MSTQLEFYLEREAQAHAEANAATLSNVRDRHLRSAIAWGAMALRVQTTERRRLENESRKADGN
jgi:hypothetical protein